MTVASTTYRWVLYADAAVGASAALLVAWWFGRRWGGASAAWLLTWSGIGALVGAIVFWPSFFMATAFSRVSPPPEPRSLFWWNAVAVVVLAAGFCARVSQNRSRLREGRGR